MTRLDNAIKFATEVHKDQVDLGGNPYILHPLRVLCRTESYLREQKVKDRESILCSAVLHDCVEDSKYDNWRALIEVRQAAAQEGLDDGYVVEKTVDTLTRRKPESWKNYINRIKPYWAPRLIKIFDLEDNLDLSRLPKITEKDQQRNKMYLATLNELRELERK